MALKPGLTGPDVLQFRTIVVSPRGRALLLEIWPIDS